MTTNLIAQIITLAASAFSLLVLLVTIWQMRKESRVSKLAPLIAIATTLLTTLVYVFITGASVNWITASVLLALGFLIGLGQGRATRVYYRGAQVVAKRSIGYLILWMLAYLVTIGLAQWGSGLLHAVGILGMIFGTGAAMGANLVLFIRRNALRPPSAAPWSPGNLPERGGSSSAAKPTRLPR